MALIPYTELFLFHYCLLDSIFVCNKIYQVHNQLLLSFLFYTQWSWQVPNEDLYECISNITIRQILITESSQELYLRFCHNLPTDLQSPYQVSPAVFLSQQNRNKNLSDHCKWEQVKLFLGLDFSFFCYVVTEVEYIF